MCKYVTSIQSINKDTMLPEDEIVIEDIPFNLEDCYTPNPRSNKIIYEDVNYKQNNTKKSHKKNNNFVSRSSSF